jgi:hypothetical protein
VSKHNIVNPDHYTIAGRERPGKTDPIKFTAKSTEEEERARWDAKRRSKKTSTKTSR